MRYQNDLAEFERYLIDQEKSRATVSKYLRDTKGLLIFLDGRELSKELMVEYKNLLAEGWDSPITEVLFMARPTMSKTIYMQQLGRGMRTHEGKDFLMVFDFVDNANMFNCPYSLHCLLRISEYTPDGLVLGKKSDIEWDRDMFRKGTKPAVLVDFPVHVMDYEVIDIFNWQEKANEMYSENEECKRCISAISNCGRC